MTTNAEQLREMLTNALIQTKIVDQRLYSTPQSLRTATRMADRLVIANGITSVRLTLSVIEEELRDALDLLRILESEGD